MARRLFLPIVNVFAITLLFSLLGCSSGPSSSEAEEFVRGKIDKQSQGRIKLVSFSKTNGLEATPNGVRTYQLDYEADIEFADDCRWGTQDAFGHWRGDFSVFPHDPPPDYGYGPMPVLYPPFREATKGSRTKVQGSVIFQKTEAGWRRVEEPPLL
jgi:hypothetical protein